MSEQIDYDIKRLRLEPGDVLLFRATQALSPSQHAYFVEQITTSLKSAGITARFLAFDTTVELSVLSGASAGE